jgi:hypothetical protein
MTHALILSNRRCRRVHMSHMTYAVMLNEVKALPPRVQAWLSTRPTTLPM